MFRRNTRKTFGQNVRKTPVRCKKYGTVSADGYAQQNTKACLSKHAFFSINNKKCSGKMYIKRLYGAKNAVQKC